MTCDVQRDNVYAYQCCFALLVCPHDTSENTFYKRTHSVWCVRVRLPVLEEEDAYYGVRMTQRAAPCFKSVLRTRET